MTGKEVIEAQGSRYREGEAEFWRRYFAQDISELVECEVKGFTYVLDSTDSSADQNNPHKEG